MIYYLTMADNIPPLRTYLKHWGRWLRRRLLMVPYEELPDADALPDATFFFTDIERLPPELAPKVAALWATLRQRGERVRLLNDPTRVLQRYELLRALHTAGRNAFNAYLLGEPRGAIRFPAFVRSRTEHHGPYSPLLQHAAELDPAIAAAQAEHPGEELMIVEYIDVATDGIYAKYSATRVGDAMLAHHVMFKDKWVVKSGSLKEPWMFEADRQYRDTNPHKAELIELFDIAHIDYGRIDYSVLNGQIQVWEINSNPTPLYRRSHYNKNEIWLRERFARKLNWEFTRLDDRSPETKTLHGRWRRLRDSLR